MAVLSERGRPGVVSLRQTAWDAFAQGYENWLEYASKNYMSFGADGKVETFMAYCDPMVDFKLMGAAATGVGVGFYILPQNQEICRKIYEGAAAQNHWSDSAAVTGLSPQALIMARELGDSKAMEKLSAAAEAEFEPKYFGTDRSHFGWWFKLNEKFPRGQRSALMTVAEVGAPGDWVKSFEVQHMDKFDSPTVSDVQFPAMGISRAWNDLNAGVLRVDTYAASPDRKGAPTTWRVTGLPNARSVKVRLNGQPYKRFHVEGPGAIRIDGTIDAHRYEVITGYHGKGARAAKADGSREHRAGGWTPRGMDSAGSAAMLVASDAALASCPCCNKIQVPSGPRVQNS